MTLDPAVAARETVDDILADTHDGGAASGAGRRRGR